MKIKVAAQTLSISVKKALRYLKETNHSLNFQKSEPIETFLININGSLDILNSRKSLVKNLKCGLQNWNKENIFCELMRYSRVFKSLKESPGGQHMYLIRRKMGFIGMIFSHNSLMSIFEDHVSSNEQILKYVLAFSIQTFSRPS